MSMSTITLTKNEYRTLQKKADVYDAFWGQETKIRKVVPVVYLSGKSAKKLDRRVASAWREHKAGRTRPISLLFGTK